jgi:hypothetical protein
MHLIEFLRLSKGFTNADGKILFKECITMFFDPVENLKVGCSISRMGKERRRIPVEHRWQMQRNLVAVAGRLCVGSIWHRDSGD